MGPFSPEREEGGVKRRCARRLCAVCDGKSTEEIVRDDCTKLETHDAC